jgi:hypothetical protein
MVSLCGVTDEDPVLCYRGDHTYFDKVRDEFPCLGLVDVVGLNSCGIPVFGDQFFLKSFVITRCIVVFVKISHIEISSAHTCLRASPLTALIKQPP